MESGKDLPKQGLSKEQKTGFVLLLVFGILAVSLGALQMRNSIYSPFVIHFSKTESQVNNLFSDEETRLQSIDTDRDGLNDFEELTFYETSPYLPDTDSDGIDDKEEIEEGADPLCPLGQTCGVSEAVTPIEPKPIISPLLEQNFGTLGLMNLSGETAQKDINSADVLEILKDPNQVRQLFLTTGEISQAELSEIDDDTLMAMVDELLKEEGMSLSGIDAAAIESEVEETPAN